MQESYIEKYYTLGNIPEHRKQFIDGRIAWLIENYGLKGSDWPLDCVKLLMKIKNTQIIPFTCGFFNLPLKYDAVTQYIPNHNLYIMQINKNKLSYPFQYSNNRRCNFTICHEIGHIVLGHLLIPRHLKTEEELAIEEYEADEFAGRFLMPEKLIMSCNLYTMDSAARYFMVSKTALWKRLNNMKKLNLF